MPMAMTMSGEQQLTAPRERVWAALNDIEVLKACIPGCESLELVAENEFVAVASNRIGPVKARFKGKVRLTDLDPPRFQAKGTAVLLDLPRVARWWP
jgi:carbon monoxide dehydrogenase subunit G